MFRKIWNWLFNTGRKPNPIIEPAGGIDGMTIEQAYGQAMLGGHTISRIAWNPGAYLEYVEEPGSFTLHLKDSIHENWRPTMADHVSVDWFVVEKD